METPLACKSFNVGGSHVGGWELIDEKSGQRDGSYSGALGGSIILLPPRPGGGDDRTHRIALHRLVSTSCGACLGRTSLPGEIIVAFYGFVFTCVFVHPSGLRLPAHRREAPLPVSAGGRSSVNGVPPSKTARCDGGEWFLSLFFLLSSTYFSFLAQKRRWVAW